MTRACACGFRCRKLAAPDEPEEKPATRPPGTTPRPMPRWRSDARSMKMYTKVLLSLLVTALVPLLLVTSAVYWSSREALKGMAVNTLDAAHRPWRAAPSPCWRARRRKWTPGRDWRRSQDVFTGEDIDLRMGLLLLGLQQNSDFLEVLCTDTNGRIVAASNLTGRRYDWKRRGHSIGAFRSAHISPLPLISMAMG